MGPLTGGFAEARLGRMGKGGRGACHAVQLRSLSFTVRVRSRSFWRSFCQSGQAGRCFFL